MKLMKTGLVALALAVGATWFAAALADPIMTEINYQGVLLENGEPAGPGTVEIEIRIYDAVAGGTLLETTGSGFVPVAEDGSFTASIFAQVPEWGDGEQLYAEIVVNGQALSPRVAVRISPASIYSLNTRGIEYQLGKIGIGTESPQAQLHISSSDLGGGYDSQDELIVEGSDAWIGLYSSPGGSVGSVFRMAELLNGAVVDSWNFSRRTSGSGSQLRFRYADGSGNLDVVELTPGGQLLVNEANGGNGTLEVKQIADDSAGGVAVVNSGDTRAFRMWVDGSGNGRISHRVDGNGEIIVNDGGGFVGVNTTSPDAHLHVAGSPGELAFKATKDFSSNTPVAQFEGEICNASDGVVNAINFGCGPGLVSETRNPGGAAFVARRDSTTGNDVARFEVGINNAVARINDQGWGYFEKISLSGAPLSSSGAVLSISGDAVKPGGGPWSALSDARLKKNILDLEDSLERMLALRGTTYEPRYANDARFLPGVQTGFIAQEVEQVFPEWVDVDDDGYRVVSIQGFEALTVEALRELRAEKDAEIAELRDRVVALEAMVMTLLADQKEGR